MNMERRSPKRHIPDSTIQVTDIIANRTAGIIVNLSSSGFLLMTSLAIRATGVHQFRLLTDGGNSPLDITLGASCLWCAPAETANNRWGGFQIIDISAEDKKALTNYLKALP